MHVCSINHWPIISQNGKKYIKIILLIQSIRQNTMQTNKNSEVFVDIRCTAIQLQK